MTRAVDAATTTRPTLTPRGTGRNAHHAGAGFDAMLSLLGEPAGGVGPGPETIGRRVRDELKDPGRVELDDIAAEEMRTVSEKPEHLKVRDATNRPGDAPPPQARPAPAPSARPQSAAPQPAPPSDAVQTSPSKPTAVETSPAARAVGRPAATATPPNHPAAINAAAAPPPRATPTPAAPSGGVRSVSAVSAAQSSGKDLLAKLETRQKPPILRASKEEVPAQVSRALARIVSEGGGRMTLRLNPHALGEVRIDVEMRRGVASARLNTRTDAARDLLNTELDTLRTALERRGVTVERLEVIGPNDETGPRTDADAERSGDHPPGAGETDRHGRSAARRHGSAETDHSDRPGAEHGADSWTGPPVRTDADGVVRVDAIA